MGERRAAEASDNALSHAIRQGRSGSPLVRFALLTGFPLTGMTGVTILLLGVPLSGADQSSLAFVVLALLVVAVGFTIVNLRATYEAERTTNTVLTELGRQALHVAGVPPTDAVLLEGENRLEWLTQTFEGMVSSLQRERSHVAHRLADLEAVNLVAGAIIDTLEPAEFDERMVTSAVRALRASGGVFVSAAGPTVTAAAGVAPLALRSLGERRLLGNQDTPVRRALSHAMVADADMESDQPFDDSVPSLVSLELNRALALPVGEQGRAVAAIELYFHDDGSSPRRSLAEQRPLLETLGRLIGVGQEYALALRELRESNVALARANRLKSEFLANMSHEFRTPMNSIIGYSHVMLEGIDGPLTDEQRDDIQRVAQSAESLLAIINDILDLSKIEAGHVELHWQPIWVRPLLQSVVTTIEPMAAKKRLPLTIEIAPDIATCAGDPTRVSQMLLNLLSNAVKFTERGAVAVQVAHDGERVAFTVRDTGIGVPAEAQEIIFDEFRQADGSTSRRYGGTGLGLAITRRLARLHGSDVELVSEVGRGSAFTFRLPIALPAAGNVATSAPVPATIRSLARDGVAAPL